MMHYVVIIICFALLGTSCKDASKNHSYSSGEMPSTEVVNVDPPEDTQISQPVDYDTVEAALVDSMETRTSTITKEQSMASSSNEDEQKLAQPINDKKSGSIKNTNKKAPRIKLDSILFKQSIYSYDTITEGDVIKHEYVFENRNDVPIEVAATYPDCGCTTPSFPFLALDPGEKGHIGVTYNSVGKDGSQESKIKVKFKGIKEKKVLLLKGYVKPKK